MIYEYQCNRCQHKFELIRKYEDRDKAAPCPKCKEGEGKRQLSAGTLILISGIPTIQR